AGMAAAVGRSDELAAVYHNPAGLTFLPGTHFYVSLGFAFPTTSLRLRPWTGSNRYLHDQLDSQGYYPEAVPSRAFGAIPMIAASTNLLSDKVWGALSLYVPNAIGSAFPDDSVVRYHIVDGYIVA